MFMRRPARPMAGLGNRKSGNHSARLYVFANQDVEIACGRRSARHKMKRVVFLYILIVDDLQRIFLFHIGGELGNVSRRIGGQLNR